MSRRSPRRGQSEHPEDDFRRLAYPMAAAVLLLAFVLLFVVNTAWPLAIGIAIADLVFIGLVAWYYRER